MFWMCREFCSPMCWNDLPPSEERYTPPPHDVLCRLFDSPAPTHTSSGSLWDAATSPMEMSPSSWNSASQVVPMLLVFQSPPWAVPT